MVRVIWLVLGLGACALGVVGVVVPGLPSTVFFIVAAGCFARSSPRLLEWVLSLPRIGPMVRDFREGRGIPRRAKVGALTTMAVVGGVSLFTLPSVWQRVTVLALLVIGAWVVGRGIPTRAEDDVPGVPRG